MVEFVLRDVDVGHVLCAPEKKVRKDHPVCGPVSDNHDVLRIAAQIQRFLDAIVNPFVSADIVPNKILYSRVFSVPVCMAIFYN